MTKVKFNEARIIPAPLVSFQRNFTQLENGDIIGENYDISVTGKIIGYMGSPNSDGEFWYFDDYPEDDDLSPLLPQKSRLARILIKQEALKDLFSKENIGKKFEIIPEDGISPIFFLPTSISISFPEGTWYDTCDYTINMQTDRVAGIDEKDDPNLIKITSGTETWAIEPLETPTKFDIESPVNNKYGYRLSHSLSAQGLTHFVKTETEILKKEGLEEARKWVTNKTGYGFITASGVLSLDDFKAYNHTLIENIDNLSNTYSINENWLFGETNYIEEYNIQSNSSEGLTRVTIDGTITGLEARTFTPAFRDLRKKSVTVSSYQNAKARFNVLKPLLHNIAQTESGTTLNPVSISNTVGKNPVNGTINFSFEYDNRPCFYISGAQSENINVSYGYASKRFASIPVLGRTKGPVLQALGTSDAKTKSLNIDFVLTPRSGCEFNASDSDFPFNLISNIVNSLDPINHGATKSFYDQPQSTWNPHTRAGSYSINWTWE